MALSIYLTALAGIVLSVYLFLVERKVHAKEQQTAMCDITSKVSCSKVVASEYGKTFGIPNSILGLGYYFGAIALAFLSSYDPIFMKVLFYLGVFTVFFMVYLIYIMYVKIKSYCIVCHATYVVNILLLIFSYLNM